MKLVEGARLAYLSVAKTLIALPLGLPVPYLFL